MRTVEPCPFCGWRNRQTIVKLGSSYAIECRVCECRGGFRMRPDFAVQAWNMRRSKVNETEVVGTVEQDA